MKRPDQPDTSRDDYLADARYAHLKQPDATVEGISPRHPTTMPRGEDDDETRWQSPEFHDRPGAPWAPDKSSR